MPKDSLQQKDVSIRSFRIQDYDEVITLWKQSQLPFKPLGRDKKESIEKEITQDTALFYVAEYQGHIIGSIFATHDGRKGWINRLAVQPQNQNQGIGRLLIQYIERIFDQKGIDIITCLVEEWNQVSLDFFERMGFIRHDDIIYYSKRKHDHV